jgi:hypothetical protein
MIAAIIVIILLTALIATDSDHSDGLPPDHR